MRDKKFATFNLNTFDSLRTFENRIEYIKKLGLELVGEGGERVVFALNPEKVVKLQRSKYGTQNQIEAELAVCSDSKYTTRTYQHAKDYSWIVAEKVRLPMVSELNSKIAELTYGLIYNVSHLGEVISSPLIRAKNKLMTKYQIGKEKRNNEIFVTLMETNDWFKGFYETLLHCNIDARDFHEGNFGIRDSDDSLVLLDYGFDIY